MSRLPEFGGRLSAWERRLNEADRRIRDLELRGVLLEQGALQAQASQYQAAGSPSLATQLFWLTAAGCNSLALATENLSAYLSWVNVYQGSTPYGTWTADPTLTQTVTTDGTGYAAWLGVYPYWITPGGVTLTMGNTYPLSWSGSAYYYDPAGSYTGILAHTAGRSGTGYTGWGYNGTFPYGSYVLNPGANGWRYLVSSGYLCWSGLARPVSAHTLNVSGGGGGTFNSSYASFAGTRTGNIWNWNGSTWVAVSGGSYHLYWSLDTSTKALTLGVYHISFFGGDAPVSFASESLGGVSYATQTVSPTVTAGPFTAAYTFSGAVSTLTGITTVTLTEP